MKSDVTGVNWRSRAAGCTNHLNDESAYRFLDRVPKGSDADGEVLDTSSTPL